DASVMRRFALEADVYRLPELPDCGSEARDQSKTRLQESRERWEQAKRTQGYGQFPVPPDRIVEITPRRVRLESRHEQQVAVVIEPRHQTLRGTRSVRRRVYTEHDRA